MSQQPQRKNHVKTVGLIMAITLVGKILGLVRDMLLGHNFATGMESNAFQVASRIPRTFFDAIFASAVTASFIPVFNDRLEKHGREDAYRLSGSFFTWVGLLTCAVSLLGALLAEPLVGLLADGFDARRQSFAHRCCEFYFLRYFSQGLLFPWWAYCSLWESFISLRR